MKLHKTQLVSKKTSFRNLLFDDYPPSLTVCKIDLISGGGEVFGDYLTRCILFYILENI